MSELDTRVAKIQAQYDAAIRDGSIDPKKMDVERFADMLADDIEYHDAVAPDFNTELSDSKTAVADLMQGRKRNSVLSRWFGKDK